VSIATASDPTSGHGVAEVLAKLAADELATFTTWAGMVEATKTE